jgi:prepilin-type N-terminal cleavage/methylation domain-containing protein
MASTRQRGFSLLEMVITISIGMILAGITYMGMRPLLYQSHVNEAYDTTLMALRNTRNLAITQSHQYNVTFNPAGYPVGTILIQYQPPAVGGIAQPVQTVITYAIPVDVSFAVPAAAPPGTPDNFGNGTVPLDFENQAGVPLNPATVVFMPDGSAQDINGNLIATGIVYMTQPNQSIYSSRAVTVWGATGRIRGWRLNQIGGGPKWGQH